VISLLSGFIAGNIPWRLIGIVSLILGSFYGGWWVNGNRWEAKVNAAKAEQQAQALEADKEARKLETKRASVAQEVQTDYAQKQTHMAAVNVAARSELDGLRQQLDAVSLAASSAETTSRANAERVRVLGSLLAESLELSEEGREHLAGAVAKLEGLQAWAAKVCVTTE
jgi:hypothetical protein